MNIRAITSLTGILFLTGGSTVWAQEPPERRGTLEEIVVTAEFAEKDLQQTPIAISAINSDMLEARSITNITQFGASAPNVNLSKTQAGFGNSMAAFIRGVGQQDFSPALEPGVGVYIDDVYYATVFGSAFDLVDVDRIEILRGPQGTLAGKNSVGGAIKLYSKKPDENSDGYLDATIGSYDRVDISGSGDFTVVEDKMYARVSGISRHRDGYVDIVDYGCAFPNSGIPATTNSGGCKTDTLGGQSLSAGRLYLRALPSDTVEISIIGDVTSDKSEGVAATSVDIAGNPVFGYDDRFEPNDPYVSYSTFQVPAKNLSVPNVNTVDNWGVSATLDWEIADNLALKWITAYREVSGRFTDDSDGSPLGVQIIDITMDSDQFTQEIRLSGSVGDKLDWTLGGFYYEGDIVQGGQVDLESVPVLVPPDVFPNFTFGLAYWLQDDKIDNKSKSAFAHGVYHLTDRLDLTAGIRYTEEQKSYLFQRELAGGITYNPGVTDINGQTGKFDGDNTDYRLALSYSFDNAMIYAQYATGFKGGGVVSRPFEPQQVQPFDPETVETYEVGFKSTLLDNRLRLNMGAFYSIYDDMQLNIRFCPDFSAVGGVPCAMTRNAGDAEITGFEAEVEFYPIDGLLITASGGYIDFEYQSVDPTTDIPLSGNAPYTPEINAALGVQYEIPFYAGSLTPRIDVRYQSETNADPRMLDETELAERTLVDARLTWRSASGQWESALAVTNLTDKVYYYNILNYVPGPGLQQGVIAPPREWSFSIKRIF